MVYEYLIVGRWFGVDVHEIHVPMRMEVTSSHVWRSLYAHLIDIFGLDLGTVLDAR